MPYYFSGGSIFFSSMEGTEEPPGGSYFVGKREELIAAKRSCRTIEDRDILVIHHQDAFYAIDSYCYREFSTLSLVTPTNRQQKLPDTFSCVSPHIHAQPFPPCCWSQRQLKFWFVWNITLCKVPSICHQMNQCHNIETTNCLLALCSSPTDAGGPLENGDIEVGLTLLDFDYLYFSKAN